MGKLYGTYLVAPAVLSLVVTFTSAANLGEACSAAGDCKAANAVCETTCVCKGQYKANADNTACIQRGLNDTCTASTNSDCAGVTNAVCKPTDNVCACLGAYKRNGAACIAKGLNDSCAAGTNSDCLGVTHAVCKSTVNVCACEGAYKQNGAACVAKAVGDSCTQHTDCSTGDTNSECSADNPKKCVCKTDFTAINNVCKKGLNDTCTASAHSECAGVPHAVCKTTDNICACVGAYKQNGATCVAKAVGDSCTQHTDCSTGDTNSECSTENPKKCVCKTDFTAINNVCKTGLGNTCTDGTSCSAVSNAECVGSPKKCACKANFKVDKGQCSPANGLQTLLSAPGVLLLSFLTIVVTRLH